MCIYGIFGTIVGFIISKKGKMLDPKKIEVLVKMQIPKHPMRLKSLMDWPSFTYASLEILQPLWPQSPSYSKKLKCLNGLMNVKPLGRISKTGTFKPIYLLILTGK
jgi:hypothetical protein